MVPASTFALPVALAVAALAAPAFTTATAFAAEPVALLERYCLDCHDSDSSKAGIDLEALLVEQPLVRNAAAWQRIATQIRDGAMPPKKKTQPQAGERAAVLAWLKSEVDDFDYDAVDHPGRVPPRRLTVTEYRHAVRDLLGVELEKEGGLFPSDLRAGGGFDNNAGTLFLQDHLMPGYIRAAETAFDQTKRKLEDREALAAFVNEAWRRPANKAEVDALLEVGKSPAAAGRIALLSPHFLIRTEKTPEAGTRALEPDELANRLAAFLWASIPDAVLREAAANGSLATEPGLLAQVDRMLADPKADALGSEFATQWFGTDILGVRVRLDPIDNPWCTDSLMTAMRRETELHLLHLMRENRPAHELVHAPYTFLNEELARHYRIRGVEGDAMRKVSLQTANRGGVLSHGAVLAITSYPDRTSPVRRGTWILDNLLGTPPPPPPEDVADLDEVEVRGRELSLRQRLKLHRRAPACAGCHEQIDPLGFGLENYEKFGRWRRVRDNSGQLPGGETFRGPAGLKRVILETRYDDLRRQFARKLLAYALGRQLEYFDERALRRIIARLETNDNGLRHLVHGVVLSRPFRYTSATEFP